MKERRLLFSLTEKDFTVQTFCTGGNGGQHRNAKRNGVRIIHPASGARAEHRDGRDQGRNKIEAFKKLVETPEFRGWHRLETLKRMGLWAEIERQVEAEMAERNLRVEVKDEDGKWTHVG